MPLECAASSPRRNSDGRFQQFFQIERAILDGVLKGLPFQKFHGDEGFAAVFANIVNGADVGMIQRRSGLCFALETRERLGIRRNGIRQKFQRDKTQQACVFRLVNDAHPPAANPLDNAIVRDCLVHSGGAPGG